MIIRHRDIPTLVPTEVMVATGAMRGMAAGTPARTTTETMEATAGTEVMAPMTGTPVTTWVRA